MGVRFVRRFSPVVLGRTGSCNLCVFLCVGRSSFHPHPHAAADHTQSGEASFEGNTTKCLELPQHPTPCLNGINPLSPDNKRGGIDAPERERLNVGV
jgi:hypothetical protein